MSISNYLCPLAFYLNAHILKWQIGWGFLMIAQSKLELLNAQRIYDLAFVGSGVSNAFTLLNFLGNLDQSITRQEKLRIAVIERDSQLWTGLVYGNRSSVNSLLINNLREFIPAAIKEDFIHWLEAHRIEWSRQLAESGGTAAETWLAQNKKNMDIGNWDDLFLPRRLFGSFLTEQLEAAIARAQKAGYIELDRLHAQVESIRWKTGKFDLGLKYHNGDPGFIKAQLAILGIGSSPVQALRTENLSPSHKSAYLADIYITSLDANIDRIRKAMDRTPAARNLLIVGSNASALEVIYLCDQIPELRKAIDKIVCISRSGKLPEIGTRISLDAVILDNLERLKKRNDVQSDELMAAICNDAGDLPRQGVTILDAFPKISEIVVSILGRMDKWQARHFYHNHGNNFSRMVRRGGQEYVDAAVRLKTQNRLTMVPGRFVSLQPGSDNHLLRCVYAANSSDTTENYALEFGMVVNCSGFEALDNTNSSKLISTLIRHGTCQVNPSGHGFEVNNDFEASPNFFVAGPLLAGIFNDRLRSWHIENARKIYGASEDLAKILIDRVEAREVPGAFGGSHESLGLQALNVNQNAIGDDTVSISC